MGSQANGITYDVGILHKIDKNFYNKLFDQSFRERFFGYIGKYLKPTYGLKNVAIAFKNNGSIPLLSLVASVSFEDEQLEKELHIAVERSFKDLNGSKKVK